MNWRPGFPRILFAPDEGAGGGGGGAPSGGGSDGASSSGVTSAPVSTPVSVTTGSSTPSLKDNELPASSMFENLGLMGDDPPEAPALPSDEPEGGIAPQPPQEPPAPPQAAQTQQPPAPQQTEPTQQPTGEPPQPAASASPLASAPFSRETIEQIELPENREALIQGIFDQFQLTEEDLTGLATDAAPVLRRIAARVLYAGTLHTLKTLRDFTEQSLPALLEQHQEVTRRAETHNTRFNRMWPALADPKYAADIEAAAARVKKMPGITQEGLYRAVGRMVAAQYGLTLSPVEVQTAPNGGASQGAPLAVTRQPAPFAPAAPGSGPTSHPSQSNGASSPFEGLGMDFD